MRRALTIVAALVALVAVAVPALAASDSVNVPRKFGSALPKVRSRSGVPVLLPSRLRAPVRSSRVFGEIIGLRRGRYHLALGVGRHCREATACFVAAFFAQRGAALTIKRKVRLAHGIVGRFRPITCGASCAAAEIQWREHGVAYETQYKGTKSQLVALANSAIRAGAR